MTGKFTEKDPARCYHYARFMSHLTLAQANAVFWLLFVTVLILMCISSIQHHKFVYISSPIFCIRQKHLTSFHRSIALGARLNDRERGGSAAEVTEQKKEVRRLRRHQLGIVSLCLILFATAAVFECFALFNIEFCDGEDLMQLYWGFWSVMQVGSNIAILGVMVQFWIVLSDHETPSWAVALGTPVLVFAALGFVFHSIGAQTWDRCRGNRPQVQEGENPEDGGGNESSGSETDIEKYDRRDP
ncbi:hypothetical protein L207DRAFT_564960 [Hyaloscypha variabilis F]|uniref:Transmembrane protein n=1 Tax=Hyaloscypha variabilis (strain UAMH 11265 / GT02V1 / F) TaxID=1149755 RepID=A0A2J6RW37_HYAVF|nr:hypothetical protein L207DRAFT_564960 [Hyaloscypha variabilis F]